LINDVNDQVFSRSHSASFHNLQRNLQKLHRKIQIIYQASLSDRTQGAFLNLEILPTSECLSIPYNLRYTLIEFNDQRLDLDFETIQQSLLPPKRHLYI